MAYGIKCLGMAGVVGDGSQPAPVGQWLSRFDAEAFNGRGYAEWTDDARRALRFVRSFDAFVLWRSVPANRATRPDGKLNRPLTAFHIAVEALPI
jgi:hypothetical protein